MQKCIFVILEKNLLTRFILNYMYVIVAESLNVLMQSYKWSELYYICMCLFWVYRWAMLSYGFVLGLPLGNVVV